MSTNPLLYSALLLSLLMPVAAQALPEDARKPIHISADTASRNEQSGITRYEGDVLLVQGSLKITGNSLELRQKNGEITTIIAKGGLAHFQQRPQHDEEITHAYGQVLNYNVISEQLEITGKAKVSQGTDSFSGNRIVYDMRNSNVKAFAAKQNKGERVQMVIQPKASAETPSQTTPSAKDTDTQ